MSLVSVNWRPTDRQLRQFAAISLIALPGLGWYWSDGHVGLTLALGALGLVLGLLSLIRPGWLAPLFVLLSLVTIPIGLVVGEIIMLAIYGLMFVPLGLAFRLLRRDALQLQLDRQAQSYWTVKKTPVDVASYYRQS